jgi:hypothetical protein
VIASRQRLVGAGLTVAVVVLFGALVFLGSRDLGPSRSTTMELDEPGPNAGLRISH